MRGWRATLVYWGLILLPTAALCLLALRLLRHEQERIEHGATEVARERAEAAAEAVVTRVAEIETRLSEELRSLPDGSRQEALEVWRARSPLIRNVFVWEPAAGTVLPSAGDGDPETRDFLRRFEPLFAGRVPWQRPAGDSMPAAARSHTDILRWTRQSPRAPERGSHGSGDGGGEAEGGWLPWFSGDALCLLGWVSISASGAVYGVEVESMTLLSQLVTAFPGRAPTGLALALLDGSGAVLHQVGAGEVKSGDRPAAVAGLAPLLPHWEVAAYLDGAEGPRPGAAFFTLAVLVVLGFVAAILTSAVLMTREAQRNRIEALKKTSFVANVSHELKTPLTSIRMYAELLGEGGVQDPEKRQRYSEVIATESQRLTRLVNNALDFSRLEQGRKTYRLEPLDLAQALREVLDDQALRLAEAGLRLDVSGLPEGTLTALADRDSVEQVFLNLLDNAIKYAASGGELAVTARTRAGGGVEVRFLDRGGGVSAIHRRHLFKDFYRADDSLAAAQSGCGLGLSICRRLLQGMGGSIRYEPRQGGGSAFVVELPGADAGCAQRHP